MGVDIHIKYLWVVLVGSVLWAVPVEAQLPPELEEAISWRLEEVIEADAERLGRASGPNNRCNGPCRAAPFYQTATELFEDPHGPFPLVSIAPYFEDKGAWHEAGERLGRRDCEGALKALDKAEAECGAGCEGLRAIEFRRAGALWCAGQKKASYRRIKALDELGYPGMEMEVRQRHRDYARALGRPVPAVLSPSLGRDADGYISRVIKEARKQADRGRVAEALASLHKAEGESHMPQHIRRLARVEAEILRKAERLEEAAEVYVRLWASDPEGRIAEEMASAIDRLIGAGLETDALGADERLDRVVFLASRGQKKALRKATERYVRRFKLRAGDQQALGDLCDGVYQEKKRDREKALRLLGQAERGAQHPAIKARALLYKALALRRLDRDDEAIEAYDALIRDHPEDHKVDEALYQAARLRLYKGHYDRASEGMAQLVAQYPDSPLLPDGLWQAAWTGWLSGNWDKALGVLDHLRRHHGQQRELSGLTYELKAMYWRARCLGKLGRTQEAIDGYRRVIERYPLTYYAAMAWHQIEALGVDPDKAVPFQPDLVTPMTPERVRDLSRSRVPAHPRVRRGLELWRTGQRQEAKRTLTTQLQFRDPPRGVVELLATFHLLDGDVHSSYWMAWKHGDFSVAPYEGNARFWGLSYPAPERLLTIARDVAADIGSDPMLPFAIIRHESGFRSEVTSSVGARGLMQVMPGSAKVVRRIWYDGKGPRNLRNDRDNMRLGMTLVQMHHHYFVGNLPLVIGGYNAGSGVAERWWRQFGDLDTDALVEQMTYPRTAAYVKKVIGSYYAYRVLYGEGTPPHIALSLPESLGTWKPAKDELIGLKTR